MPVNRKKVLKKLKAIVNMPVEETQEDPVVAPHIAHKRLFISRMIDEWGFGVTFVQEHRFDPDRMWRFDFAFPEFRVAVEVEGGTFTGGRHSRGAGMSKDFEKYNNAESRGWHILKATPAMLNDDEFLVLLFDLLVYKGAIIQLGIQELYGEIIPDGLEYLADDIKKSKEFYENRRKRNTEIISKASGNPISQFEQMKRSEF